MDHTFNFSIRTALRQAWATFRLHAGFFLSLAVITIVLSIVGGGNTPWYVQLILTLASFIWSIVWLRVSLAAARNDETKMTFSSLRELIPTGIEILYMIGIFILGGLIVLCGLILLIIPGIYVAFRLSFANLAYLDRKEGIQKSLRYSWNITKGKFWTVFLTGIVAFALYMVGILTLGIGLLITYPLASILIARLYIVLSEHYHSKEGVVVQPVEIPADLPATETV